MIQAQRDFVADASHELRTPLTSILANLELLEASLADARRATPTRRRSSPARSARRGGCGAWSPTCCCSRAPTPAAPGPAAPATWPRSRPRRSPRCGPSPSDHELELDGAAR